MDENRPPQPPLPPPPLPTHAMMPPPLPHEVAWVGYASAQPSASKIHCDLRPDGGVTLSVDPPSRARLWREAWMPVVTLGLLALGIFLNVRLIGAVAAFDWTRLLPMYLGIVICSVAIIYGILDAWQNAGIITQIDLTWPWLTWRKQTIFGTREHRWRADRITRVWVMSFGGIGNMLRIRRSNGFPMGAFGQQSKQDLEWAASALRDALRAHGAAGGGAA